MRGDADGGGGPAGGRTGLKPGVSPGLTAVKENGIPEKRRAVRKPNATGRDGARARKGNPVSRPADCGVNQFVWLPVELLASSAFRVLSVNARRVVDRLLLEHAAHGGTANGELVVSYQQFEESGVTRNLVAKAIREAEAVGLVSVWRRGRIADGRNQPLLYRLTWLGAWRPDGERMGPTHEWKGRSADDVRRELERMKNEHEARVRSRDAGKVVELHPQKSKQTP